MMFGWCQNVDAIFQVQVSGSLAEVIAPLSVSEAEQARRLVYIYSI